MSTKLSEAAPLAYSVDEVALMLRISRGLAFAMARDGRLPSRRLGRRLIVPAEALRRWLEESDDEDEDK